MSDDDCKLMEAIVLHWTLAGMPDAAGVKSAIAALESCRSEESRESFMVSALYLQHTCCDINWRKHVRK